MSPRFWRNWLGAWALFEYGWAVADKLNGGDALIEWGIATLMAAIACYEHSKIDNLERMVKDAAWHIREFEKLQKQIKTKTKTIEQEQHAQQREGKSGEPPDEQRKP